MIHWWWAVIIGFGCAVFGFFIASLLAMAALQDVREQINEYMEDKDGNTSGLN
jgi:hypothetical protein